MMNMTFYRLVSRNIENLRIWPRRVSMCNNTRYVASKSFKDQLPYIIAGIVTTGVALDVIASYLPGMSASKQEKDGTIDVVEADAIVEPSRSGNNKYLDHLNVLSGMDEDDELDLIADLLDTGSNDDEFISWVWHWEPVRAFGEFGCRGWLFRSHILELLGAVH